MPERLKTGKIEEKLLREVVDRGCREVSSRISAFLGVDLKAGGTVMGFVPIARIPLLNGNPEAVVRAARVALEKKFPGYMIFMLTYPSWELCKNLLGPPPAGTDLESSAFSEVAGIACSSFITCMADKLGFGISFSPPEVMEDMSAAVLEDTLLHFSESAELLMVEITISSARVRFTGYLFFIPGEKAVQILAERLQKRKTPLSARTHA